MTVTVKECDMDPLVPVTVTVNVPLAEGTQDRVEVPEPVRLTGLRLQVTPVEGDAEEDKPTVPVKPFLNVTIIVELPVVLTATDRLVGLAVILKSCMVTVTVAEWDRPPPVPVTVTVYTPPLPVQERVEVLEAPKTRLVGVKVQLKPVGETIEDNVIVPPKLFSGAMVIVELAAALANTVTLAGLGVTVKSVT